MKGFTLAKFLRLIEHIFNFFWGGVNSYDCNRFFRLENYSKKLDLDTIVSVKLGVKLILDLRNYYFLGSAPEIKIDESLLSGERAIGLYQIKGILAAIFKHSKPPYKTGVFWDSEKNYKVGDIVKCLDGNFYIALQDSGKGVALVGEKDPLSSVYKGEALNKFDSFDFLTIEKEEKTKFRYAINSKYEIIAVPQISVDVPIYLLSGLGGTWEALPSFPYENKNEPFLNIGVISIKDKFFIHKVGGPYFLVSEKNKVWSPVFANTCNWNGTLQLHRVNGELSNREGFYTARFFGGNDFCLFTSGVFGTYASYNGYNFQPCLSMGFPVSSFYTDGHYAYFLNPESGLKKVNMYSFKKAEPSVLSNPGINTITNIVYGNGVYLAFASGYFYISKTGSAFRKLESVTPRIDKISKEKKESLLLCDLKFLNGVFFMLDTQGYLLTSSDGENWSEIKVRGELGRLILRDNLLIIEYFDGTIAISGIGLSREKTNEYWGLIKNGGE